MEGNQPAEGNRALLAAGAFAVVAIVVFLGVWWYMRPSSEEGARRGQELTIEEKMEVLRQIRAADPTAVAQAMPIEEKNEALVELASSPAEANANMTREDKLEALRKLNQ